MKNFHCGSCGSQIFFDSVTCLGCGAMLAYLPLLCAMGSFEPIESTNRWRRLGVEDDKAYKQCVNYETHGTCNCVHDADDAQGLCASCTLTTIIPSLSNGKNVAYWRSLEAAKRWLLYSLQSLQLDPFARLPDGRPELVFHFKESGLAEGDIMTGHYDGTITLNLAEANPVERERNKEDMREPYRTVLGHFRHESGHFYFQKLVADSKWLEGFRERFGDEQVDYGESLQRYYAEERSNVKNENFISAYASSHPWEDWAETWAHYLHMVDTLETAYACGLGLKPRDVDEPKLSPAPNTLIGAAFERVGRDWLSLSYVLNSLNRSMGMPDAYPFTLSDTVLEKLAFVHRVVLSRRSPRTVQMSKPV
jgi:hypothetical protein